MARLQHSGGLVEAVIELGFDTVKYFEGTVSGTARSINNLDPPARRLTVLNTDSQSPVYVNVTGDPAQASVSFSPGDNVKIGPGCTWTMDFDILTDISFVTAGPSVEIEALLGWKGTVV